MRFGLWSLVMALGLFGADASAATLDRIKENGVVRIAYRVDAAPYSYKSAIGEPSGYTVDLCRAVTASLKGQLGLQNLSIEYVPVTAENRFEMIQQGRTDMLCGATTATLSRRALIDFSLPVFIDGASVLFRAGGPKNFENLAGHKIGVRAGTTTEEALGNTLEDLALNAHVVAVSNHDDGLQKLEANEISAYFADQAILLFLMIKSKSPKELRLSKRFFTHEPYQPVEKGAIGRVSLHGEAYRGEGGFAVLRDDEDDLSDQDGASGCNKHEQGAISPRHGLLRGTGADELAHKQR